MLNTQFQKPLVRDLAFFAVLVIAMIIIGWDSTLTKSQSEPHLWRQSDCISLAQYYAKGVPFLEPEMHSRISDDGTTGKTVAEFPILYYIVGKIWSVTGVHLWIYRLLVALMGVIALTCLYKTLMRLTDNNWFWSVLGPLLVLASPIYAFYGIAFLTNVPAFNCVLIAWHFFYRYYTEEKTKYIVWTAVFFTLAGLLKISSLTSYFMLLFVFGTELIRLFRFKYTVAADGSRTPRSIFRNPLRDGLLLLIPIVIALLWYRGFVESYSFAHYGRYSFTDPVPIWENTAEQRAHTWDVFFRFTVYQIYPAYIWFFFIAAMIFLFTQAGKINVFWLIAMPMILIGHAMFAMLFFFSLDAHDYYHVDAILFFVFVYAAMANYFGAKQTVSGPQRTFVRFTAALCMLYALLGAGNNLHMRFFGTYKQDAYCEVFSNRTTMDFLQLFSTKYYMQRPYLRVGNELTKRGFSDTVPVIAINDNSFNSVLIMVNRPGFTNIMDQFSDSTTTAQRIARGAQILLVEDAHKEHRGITAFMGYKLFTAGHISVYDLRPYADRVIRY